jgi:hypothetical protein
MRAYRPVLNAFCGCVVVSALLVTAISWGQEATDKPAAADKPAPAPADKPMFVKGETVEVWWAGSYLPGEIVAVEENGWLRVKFTVNGREQTTRHPGDGEWVRKLKAPPANKPAAAADKPAAGEPANPFAAAEQAAVRTWTDSTGKFKIEASFAGKEGESVLLTKTDGKTIKLPLAKLSKEDQDHVATLNAKPPMENPFEAAEQVADDGLDRVADWSGAEQILPQPIDGWPLAPDAAQQPAQVLAAKAMGLPGGGRERFFENPTSLLFDASKSEAVVVLVNGPPGKDREVKIVRCDLTTGRVVAEKPWTTSYTPVDLSPAGQLLACLPDQFARNESEKNKLTILRREGDKWTPLVRWKMGEGLEFAKKFDQIRFLGEDKILGSTGFGASVTLMQIEPVRALWTLKTAQNTSIALSANRTQLAAAIEGGIGIFSTASGETLARIATDSPVQGGTLSFSPNGTRLAHLSSAVVIVYDLTTGKQVHEVWFPRPTQGKSLDWVGGNFVLVDGSQVVDLEKRIVLWKYDVPGSRHSLAGHFGGRFWLVAGGFNEPFQLFSPAIPGAAEKAKGDQLTADGVLALKPGAQISLQVNLPAHAADVQKVTQALTDGLTKQGFTVAVGAPITVEATIADAGKETASYRGFGFGRFGDGDKVEVQKYTSTIVMKENGKEIWTATGHYGAPHMVHQKDGQKIEDAVNESRGNPVDFFTHVRIPRTMARHEADGAYGTSKLAP